MSKTLLFFGFGKISKAIIKGFINHGNVNASDIYVYSRNQPAVKELGCTPLVDNPAADITKSCVIAFICVKPGQFSSIVKPMISCLQKYSGGCIISVMAGVTLQTLKGAFDSLVKFSIVRTIPNLAVEFGKGVWAWTSAKESDGDDIIDILGLVSFAPFVEEKDIDTVCALSGSGIAYLIAIVEAMKNAAVFNGMNANLARKITRETMIGCGTLLKFSEAHPNQIIDDISSPGGTTIHGLTELQRGNTNNAILNAINAAVRRGREISTIHRGFDPSNEDEDEVVK
ncbi:uncharacterized protein LOC141853989 [Brevipalpus obovatus]|uniref:uncharacterized protein LOC141853989 n=1 Tax=Brevipalpus obovatus TaxID=246614 RepID=UPI003D9E9128